MDRRVAFYEPVPSKQAKKNASRSAEKKQNPLCNSLPQRGLILWAQQDSNLRPGDYESPALTG